MRVDSGLSQLKELGERDFIWDIANQVMRKKKLNVMAKG